jgi:hypothetical protein
MDPMLYCTPGFPFSTSTSAATVPVLACPTCRVRSVHSASVTRTVYVLGIPIEDKKSDELDTAIPRNGNGNVRLETWHTCSAAGSDIPRI